MSKKKSQKVKREREKKRESKRKKQRESEREGSGGRVARRYGREQQGRTNVPSGTAKREDKWEG